MAPKRAGVQVDHTSPEIEFVHEALGDTSVTVRQSLGPLGDGRDATARWVWDGAAPMAEFLCEHPERVRGKTVVELGAGPGLPGSWPLGWARRASCSRTCPASSSF